MITNRLLAPRMGIGDGAAGTAAGGGGDIYGGGDSERNAQLAALLKMFTAKSDAPIPESEGSEQATKEVDEAKRLGLRLDMPLCRYSWCILPGQQIAMSVWQPQYTLMFSTLLGQPGPHEYFHVLLPGGAESLGREITRFNEEFLNGQPGRPMSAAKFFSFPRWFFLSTLSSF
jgi:hypothetical protein